MYLADFTALSRDCWQSGKGFGAFRLNDIVAQLDWPDDVLEQWLYDHAGNDAFLVDYGKVDLTRISWSVEAISTDVLIELPTDPTDHGIVNEFAENPEHWISVRNQGQHLGVALAWATHGTWKRWPLLLDRRLLHPADVGLQIIEGRTRIGILKGLHQMGTVVAENHLVWVGWLAE